MERRSVEAEVSPAGPGRACSGCRGAPEAMPMVESLAGRVALVTGASRGIGRAIAGDLAGAGLQVVGVARQSAALDTLAAELAGAPAPGFVVPAELRDPAAVARLFEEIDARTGRIDVLVNNAGVARVEPF